LGLIRASEQQFLSNTMPSVQVDDVTIEDNGDETSKVSVDLCFTQNVKEALDPDWWFLTPSKRNKKYRVRLIASYGDETGAALDFVAQRINEYQAEMMSTTGVSGARAFLASMSQYSVRGVNISNILNPLGPFSVSEITRLIKGSEEKIVTYGDDSVSSVRQTLNDVVVTDVSAFEYLERDAKGLPSVTKDDSIGKAGLKPIMFNVPSKSLNGNLSLYCFVYYDATEENSDNSKNSVFYSLQTSSGFVDSKTISGNEYSFDMQPRGAAAFGPQGQNSRRVDNSGILNDTRATKVIDQSNPSTKLSQNVNELDRLKRLLSVDPNQKPTIDIIKDTNCFSKLWITRSDADIKRFIFSYDLRSFLLKESSFPVLYSKNLIAQELINGGELIQDFERVSVKYICMKKRQVEFESYGSLSDIGTSTRNKKIQPSATYPEEIVTIPNLVDNIFLEDSQNNSSILFYEGVDECSENRKTQSLSKFQYGVKISVTDPSLLFLERVMADLNEMAKDIQKIYDVVVNSQPNNLNEGPPPGGVIVNGRGLLNALGNKRIVPLSRIGIGSETADDIVTRVITKYISYAQKFELIPPSLILNPLETEIGLALYSLANTPKVDGILEISSFIEKLNFSIEKLLSAELPNGIRQTGNVERSTLRQRGFMQTKFVLLEKTHFFSDAIEYGNLYQTGYDYIGGDYDQAIAGLPQYSRSVLQNRFTEEFNKYFGQYANESQAPSLVDSIDGTYGNSTISFYTPRDIKVFGKKTINQPSYYDVQTNSARYDINEYASLFLDIYKLKKETQNHSPFLQMEQMDINTSLRESLIMEDCVVTDGTTEEFETYKVGNVIKSPAGKQKEKTLISRANLDQPPELFKLFLGGETDESDSSKNYFGLSDTPLKPKNFGQVDFLDKEATKATKNSKPPTKLMFNILGELHFNPIQKDDEQYENKTYNSLANISNILKITSENIKSTLEGDLSEIPNQYKSMIVIASSGDRLSLGSGFDAKRFLLEDQDVSSVDKVITNIYDGDAFPPYKNAKDPMKVYAKFLTFWMNYKQVGTLEYLAGFENLSDSDVSSSSQDKKLLPIWKKFSTDFYRDNEDRKFLCRIRSISKEDVQAEMPVDHVDLFDLPIYNKYFMLMPEEG